jgi:hypothetical protein
MRRKMMMMEEEEEEEEEEVVVAEVRVGEMSSRGRRTRTRKREVAPWHSQPVRWVGGE